MSQTADLRADAQGLGHALPALLAQAQHLAGSLSFGAHGRRRAGAGDAFWQYRPAMAGDVAQSIDWRRSAKTDAPYVRQREWQALNTVALWADGAQSMRFASKGMVSKSERAQLLALALAVALLRGGERVGWVHAGPAKTGRAQLGQMLAQLADLPRTDDYGAAMTGANRADHIVYLSDFLGPMAGLQSAMTAAADRGARGILLQILDPAEESFPYAGRTVFLSMGGSLRHETQSAADLRAAYQARLAARKDELAALARRLGWGYFVHQTDRPPLDAYIWAHHAISGAMR